MYILLVFRIQNYCMNLQEKCTSIKTALGNRSTGHKSNLGLLQSPNIMVSASCVSTSTRFLISNPNELCDKLKLLLQGKKLGDVSIKIKEEIVAIADELLEYNRKPTMQRRFLIIKRFK